MPSSQPKWLKFSSRPNDSMYYQIEPQFEVWKNEEFSKALSRAGYRTTGTNCRAIPSGRYETWGKPHESKWIVEMTSCYSSCFIVCEGWYNFLALQRFLNEISLGGV